MRPASLAVREQKRKTRADENKHSPSLWVGTGLAGLSGGYIIGANAAAIGTALGVTSQGVSAIAAAAVATFTWALVRLNASLVRNASDTLAHLQESSEREQRAYIGISIPSGSPPPLTETGHNGEYEVAVRLWNYGQTPGRNVRFRGWYEIVGPDATAQPRTVGDHQHVMNDDARADSGQGACDCDPTSDARVDALYFPIRSGKGELADAFKHAFTIPQTFRLYVYGIVDYDDVFEQPRQTKFCVLYKPGNAALGYPWTPCPAVGHNHAD